MKIKKPKNLKKRLRKPPNKVEFKPKNEYDWTVRYGNLDDYRVLCARTHAATYGKCCVCLTAKSDVVHHSRYLGDEDKPGLNVFACCSRCHRKRCHSKSNWVWDNKNPVWGNHNTAGFEKRLQTGYKILSASGSMKITPV
jgi:hypothetical protein